MYKLWKCGKVEIRPKLVASGSKEKTVGNCMEWLESLPSKAMLDAIVLLPEGYTNACLVQQGTGEYASAHEGF